MRSIFPYADEENLQKALADSFGWLEDAVDEMLEEPVFATKPCFKKSMKYSSIKDALAVQHSKFKRDKETLKVSPNEVFEDILAHFKSSTFDPLSTVRIRMMDYLLLILVGFYINAFQMHFKDFRRNVSLKLVRLTQGHLFSDPTFYYQRYLCILAE